MFGVARGYRGAVAGGVLACANMAAAAAPLGDPNKMNSLLLVLIEKRNAS